MTTQQQAKEQAALRSLGYVRDGMIVGLGTGSTASLAIRYLGELVADGLKVHGVPTSEASARLARDLGIPLLDLNEVPCVDVTIDGADEIGPGLALIKGGGGALLREKLVAVQSREVIIIADSSKEVDTLGRFPLPVEVVPFAWRRVERDLEELGLAPALRAVDGQAFLTDQHNMILDCHARRIEDPPATAARIKALPGVVEHGLFLQVASRAIVAGPHGIVERMS